MCSSAVLLLYLFIFLTFIRRICRFSTHFMWMFTCIFWATVYAIPLMIPLSFSSLSLSLYLYLYLKIAPMKNLFRKKKRTKVKCYRQKIIDYHINCDRIETQTRTHGDTHVRKIYHHHQNTHSVSISIQRKSIVK